MDVQQSSFYDQIVNAIREAQQVNELLKAHRDELPAHEILDMQQSVAGYLQEASRLLLEAEPTQLNNFWFELLGFLDTDSPVIIGVLLEFLAKSGYYSEELLASAIQLAIHFLPEVKEGPAGYERAVIGAIEDLYCAGFQYMSTSLVDQSMDLRRAIEIWANLLRAKDWILQQGLTWQSLSDFSRAAARCFQVTLIQLQTSCPSSETVTTSTDPASTTLTAARRAAEFSVNSLPEWVKFLDRQQLLKEAELQIESLLSHSWSDNSFQYTIMTMNMVSRLGKTRPQYLPHIIQWYELMHATMPTDALSQLEAESVVKLMRYQLLHFLAVLPTTTAAQQPSTTKSSQTDLAYYDRICVLLYDCGADDSQIRRYSTELQKQQRLAAASGSSKGSSSAATNAAEDDALFTRRRKRPRSARSSDRRGGDDAAVAELPDESDKLGDDYDGDEQENVKRRRHDNEEDAGDSDDDNDDDAADTAPSTATNNNDASSINNVNVVQDEFGFQYDLSEPKSAAVNFTIRRLTDVLTLENAVDLVVKFQRDIPERSPEAFLSHHFVMRSTNDGIDKQRKHLARMIAARMEAEGVGPGAAFVRQKLYELQQQREITAAAAEEPSGADIKFDFKEEPDTRAQQQQKEHFSSGRAALNEMGGFQPATSKPYASSKLSSLISSSYDDEPEPPPSQDYRPSESAFELQQITTADMMLVPSDVDRFRTQLAHQSFAQPLGTAQFARVLFTNSYWVLRKCFVFMAARFGGNAALRGELCSFIRSHPRQSQSLLLQWLSTEYLVYSGAYDERLKWHCAQGERDGYCKTFLSVLELLLLQSGSTGGTNNSKQQQPNDAADEQQQQNDQQQQQQPVFASEAEQQQFVLDLLNRVTFIPDEAVALLRKRLLANVPPPSSTSSVEQQNQQHAENSSSLPVNTTANVMMMSLEKKNFDSSASTNKQNCHAKMRQFHFMLRLFKTLASARAPRECARYIAALVEPLYIQHVDVQRACLSEITSLYQQLAVAHQKQQKSSTSSDDEEDDDEDADDRKYDKVVIPAAAVAGGFAQVKVAIESEALNMLRLLEKEVPPKQLYDAAYLRLPIVAPTTAPSDAAASASSVNLPPVWTDELVRTCSMLYMKVLQHNVHMIAELGAVFVRARPVVKRELFKAVEMPIQTLGTQPILLDNMRNHWPVGSEPLITKILNLLTQNGTAEPTAEMTQMTWHLYKTRSADVRMLLPVISALSDAQVSECMLDICRLTDAAQRDCFNRLLSSPSNTTTVTTNDNTDKKCTPLGILSTLHEVPTKRDVLTYAQLNNAFRHCVEDHAAKFTPQIVRQFIDKSVAVGSGDLPPLFMRTLMWAMKTYQKELLPYIVTNVLSAMMTTATRKVWQSPNLWQGYVRCLDLVMMLEPKSGARLLVTHLPAAQLQQVLLGSRQLRTQFNSVLLQMPLLLKEEAVCADVLAVIADPENGWKPPPPLPPPPSAPSTPLTATAVSSASTAATTTAAVAPPPPPSSTTTFATMTTPTMPITTAAAAVVVPPPPPSTTATTTLATTTTTTTVSSASSSSAATIPAPPPPLTTSTARSRATTPPPPPPPAKVLPAPTTLAPVQQTVPASSVKAEPAMTVAPPPPRGPPVVMSKPIPPPPPGPMLVMVPPRASQPTTPKSPLTPPLESASATNTSVPANTGFSKLADVQPNLIGASLPAPLTTTNVQQQRQSFDDADANLDIRLSLLANRNLSHARFGIKKELSVASLDAEQHQRSSSNERRGSFEAPTTVAVAVSSPSTMPMKPDKVSSPNQPDKNNKKTDAETSEAKTKSTQAAPPLTSPPLPPPPVQPVLVVRKKDNDSCDAPVDNNSSATTETKFTRRDSSSTDKSTMKGEVPPDTDGVSSSATQRRSTVPTTTTITTGGSNNSSSSRSSSTSSVADSKPSTSTTTKADETPTTPSLKQEARSSRSSTTTSRAHKVDKLPAQHQHRTRDAPAPPAAEVPSSLTNPPPLMTTRRRAAKQEEEDVVAEKQQKTTTKTSTNGRNGSRRNSTSRARKRSADKPNGYDDDDDGGRTTTNKSSRSSAATTTTKKSARKLEKDEKSPRRVAESRRATTTSKR